MRVNICANGKIVKNVVTPALPAVTPTKLPKKKEWEAAVNRIGIAAVATSAALTGFFSHTEAVFAYADGSGSGTAFDNMYKAIMAGFDSGVVLVIIFAGACWGLGHRGRALEILIGCCCGYLLARHAVDIRDFLKGI